MTSNKCELKLLNTVFDKILFERQGFKNNEELDLNLSIQIGENSDGDIYKVSLRSIGTKKDEYIFEVQLTGFFAIEAEGKDKNMSLIHENAVAILLPYLRSQISLLTAQPETECVVLPPFNVQQILKQ